MMPSLGRRLRAVARRPALMLIATVLFAACTPSASSTPATSAAPTAAPSPSVPTQTASTSPISSATPPPTATSSAGGAFHVELLNETGRDVTIDVTDESGRLLDAVSGTPGDGASVAKDTVVVANDDSATLRLTWAGPPCASENLLVIDAAASRITIVQPDCTGDSIAFDRILILTFSGTVTAADVEAVIQTGIDTPG
jgi:hypothetical protein